MINFDKFVDWAKNRFDDDIVFRGDEVCLNSIFTEDYKHKMWCNPYGGKNNVPNGVYHCWKTNSKGSLVTLVMKVDGCDYSDALEKLGGADLELHLLEKKLEEFWEKKAQSPVVVPAEVGLKLPPYTFPIQDLSPSNFYRVKAELFLMKRGLKVENFQVCINDENPEQPAYRNRIIIPYYDRQNTLIYFNGRYLDDNDRVSKYRGPPKELGIGKEDVLYFPHWPATGSKVYLTEGEFDAKVLEMCGFHAAALGGKTIGEKQAAMLRGYIPVIALDSDKAGRQALLKIGEFLLGQGFKEVYYVSPPSPFKDWNDLMNKLDPEKVNIYINTKEKRFTEFEYSKLKLLY